MNKTKWAGLAMGAVFAAGLVPNAEAVLLQFETGPMAGQIYNEGGITIKLAGVTAGTVYPAFGAGAFGTAGATVGVVENPAGAGVAAMNAIVGQTPPAGSTIAGEDTWGIFTVTGIFSITDPVNALWTPAGKGQEITAIFYGGFDFWARQDAAGNAMNPSGTQTFNGVGLAADFYLQTPGNYAVGLPGARVGNTYPTVTDGSLILSTVSVPGFIQAAGTDGGAAATFQSSFNGGAGGQGQTFLDVTGGADANQFNTDSIMSGFGPGITDIQAQFTTSVIAVPPGWLARVNDPLTGEVIPEPTTTLAGLACMLPVLGAVLRRRRQVTTA